MQVFRPLYFTLTLDTCLFVVVAVAMNIMNIIALFVSGIVSCVLHSPLLIVMNCTCFQVLLFLVVFICELLVTALFCS
jgi:hypothetical protein